MIRVFAQKTSMTPDDDLVFFDEPPLYDVPDLPVMVSVTFTWDIARGQRLLVAWRQRWNSMNKTHFAKARKNWPWIGGPALNNPNGDFVPGRFLKKGITITSRGCPKRCPWCLVPVRQGELRELSFIHPGNIIQDDNLLACSRIHVEAVFWMLSQQKRGAVFSGGLDIDYLQPWHTDLLKTIKIAKSGLWIACDRQADLNRLAKAKDLLGDFPIEKRRCYVLIGYDGDTPDAAERRCEQIYDDERGFLPFAQYYQPDSLKKRTVPKEWQPTVRKWSRPAAYRKKK